MNSTVGKRLLDLDMSRDLRDLVEVADEMVGQLRTRRHEILRIEEADQELRTDLLRKMGRLERAINGDDSAIFAMTELVKAMDNASASISSFSDDVAKAMSSVSETFPVRKLGASDVLKHIAEDIESQPNDAEMLRVAGDWITLVSNRINGVLRRAEGQE